MDIVNQVADTDEEEAASVKEIRRRKSRKPQKRNAISQQFYIPQEILSAKKTPQGEPLQKIYGLSEGGKDELQVLRQATFPNQDWVGSPHDGRAWS